VPDLQSMHRVLAGACAGPDLLAVRTRAILVPTRSAGESLRRTLEHLTIEEGGLQVLMLPEILTRADFYARLHASAAGVPPLLSDFEREVLLGRASRIAATAGTPPPFRLRPGLIAEMLSFYDELRRRDRRVDDFERLMIDSLEPSVEIDRGAERLMRLTRFLSAAFRQFERSIDAAAALDEHGLRRWLIDRQVPSVFRHVFLTVPDQAADPLGLWAADYDLLSRLSGLETIDVLATENVLAAGFHERIHHALPGIEEERRVTSGSPPALVAPSPPAMQPGTRWFTVRDREEELADVARRVQSGDAIGRVGVVFQRPLPYLYLARSVFEDAGVPYQALDALPLAAEPFAAALDLVFTCASAAGTRASLIELLGSPHWRFTDARGVEITRDEVVALDLVMREAKYLGGWESLDALAAEPTGDGSNRRSRLRRRAAPALEAAALVGQRLRLLTDDGSASSQVEAVQAFVRDHERRPDLSAPYQRSHARARAAILGALQALRDAYARHDDVSLSIGELAGTFRRWIEDQTFSPRTGWTGVSLLDAPAAAFADMDELRIVGLVESDWPGRARRSIFYPASLLSALGWPNESDRLAAARARFRDLLHLPRQRVSASTFSLEDDAIVSPSPVLEELESSGLLVLPVEVESCRGGFVHEALWATPVPFDAIHGEAAAWLGLRHARTSPDAERFHGFAGPYSPPGHAVSHVERYLDCPFKYFATYVLRMDEERDEESGLTPRERGQFLHDVFERFFGAWHARGRHGITAANLDEALATFAEIAEEKLAALSEVDRALERTYLMGSAAAAGLAERAFAFEIEHGIDVVERLLEYPLDGEFVFEGDGGTRRLRIRAKADRIDLLTDGTLRIIDYKLGRAPKPARALQLPIYGLCASQYLDGRHGRCWTVSRAGYVAFREKNAFVPLGGSSSLAEAVKDGQRRLLGAVSAIERGEFPPKPDEPFICTRCGYASVCRKDYVGDE
jgi:RecB family exonuclease